MFVIFSVPGVMVSIHNLKVVTFVSLASASGSSTFLKADQWSLEVDQRGEVLGSYLAWTSAPAPEVETFVHTTIFPRALMETSYIRHYTAFYTDLTCRLASLTRPHKLRPTRPAGCQTSSISSTLQPATGKRAGPVSPVFYRC